MSQKMYGVVLWADHQDHKAVIWCEDHGDLAYWHETGSTAHDGVSLDAGDLIQFDMTQDEERKVRFAHNPERVSQQFSAIADWLRNAAPRAVPARPSGQGAQVLPFRRRAQGTALFA